MSMRIQFNSPGFREILTSDGVKDLVESKAQEIKARADSSIGADSAGYKVNTIVGGYGGGRWVSFISTTDKASMIAEAEHNALTGSIG